MLSPREAVGPARSVSRLRAPRMAMVAAAVLSIAAGVFATSTASAFPPGPAIGSYAAANHGSTAFPPAANSAWAYDPAGSPGSWVNTIRDYDRQATAGREMNEIYSFGTSLVMSCPDNDGTRCTAGDLHSDYTPGSGGYANTDAYYRAFDDPHPGSLTVAPILDGYTGTVGGYTRGFSELSPQLAADYADTVASQVCADPHVGGLQADVEPFDVSTKNGQYYFYMQLAKDFAGEHAANPARDPYRCVDATHPHGRFFSVFNFATAITPGTQSAANVQDIMNTYGNGYFMDSLYDLSSAPAFTLNGIGTYKPAAQREAANTKRWANRLHIKYGYGLPAAATAHEYTTCTAAPTATLSCVPDATGATGYPMTEYAKAAVNAIKRTGATRDPDYLGTAIWGFFVGGPGDSGVVVGPTPAPADVLSYFATSLPVARRH